MEESSTILRHISVIELDFHHDSLDGFLKIFQGTEVLISVFTTAKNIRLLKDISYSPNITFHEYSKGSKYAFLKKQASIINDSQIVFINTIANDFGAYLALDDIATIILRVHNVNKQFRPLSSLFIPGSLFFLWKSFSYVLRQIVGKGFLFFRPMVNRKVDYFTFPDNGIATYVKQNAFLPENKILPSIPLKIFIEADTAYETYVDVLNVTIIGATDHRRRSYEEVVESLEQLYKHENAPAINLTLLGNTNNTYGKSIVEKLKKITNPNFKFKAYSSQVPESEFIDCIKHTHLVISPITNHATTDIFREVYGKTKTTGSILDFMKFGKVSLVPHYYSPPDDVKDYIFQYKNSAHLKETLLELTQAKKINELNRSALSFVKENYSKQIVLQKALTIFNAIIKTHKLH